MNRLAASAATLALVAATPALAQVESLSPAPDSAAVVIYRDRPVDTAQLLVQSRSPYNNLRSMGLALIVETRTIDVPAGEVVLKFRGVADGIVPQSAILDGLPGQTVERNADYDLLTPGSLLEKSVGQVVTVERTNPATGESELKRAIVRSGAAGAVLEIDGAIEALDCSGLTERIIFDAVPAGLSDQPILSVRLRSPEAGRRTVTLAYLTTGLQWSTDYVARLAPDGRTLDLTGWLTLANFGGTGFPDAPVQVVAGDIRKEGGTVPVNPVLKSAGPRCWPQDTTTRVVSEALDAYREVMYDRAASAAAPPAFAPPPPPPPPVVAPPPPALAEEGQLGDYKIYTLPGPTTVAARQTKQVRFLERADVPYEKLYRAGLYSWVSSDGTPRPTAILLKMRNRTDAGLGVALPGGSVSLYQQHEARPSVFDGQSRFDDRPVGLPVELPFGQSSDVTVTSRVVSKTSRLDGVLRTSTVEMTAIVRNAGDEAARVELPNGDSRRVGYRVLSQSDEPALTDAGLLAWTFDLAPGESRILTYRFEATE